MATLKGIFEPKPQQQKNFLLENIKKVKVRSRLNNKKDDKAGDLYVKHKKSISESFPSSSRASSKIQKPLRLKSDVTFPIDKNARPAAQKQNDRQCCCCASEKLNTGHSNEQRVSSKTMHYIHQENVPFEWTEMCPSLVSHRICHQSVQTEECSGDKVLKSENENSLINTPREEKELNAHESSYETLQGTYPPCNERGKMKAGKMPSQQSNRNRGTGQESSSSASNETSTRFNFVGESKRDATLIQVPAGVQTANKTEKNKYGRIDYDEFGEKIEKEVEPHRCSKLVSDLESLNISSQGSSKKPSSTLLPSSYQKGVVPKYLTRRKNEQLMEAAQLKDVDPNCPEGHVAMPDSERKETLDLILKNYNDLITELNKMPVRTDTLKTKQRKIELEKQLDKLEEGIRVFSRSKVYIKLDE